MFCGLRQIYALQSSLCIMLLLVFKADVYMGSRPLLSLLEVSYPNSLDLNI